MIESLIVEDYGWKQGMPRKFKAVCPTLTKIGCENYD
jgi:hypothetical protein